MAASFKEERESLLKSSGGAAVGGHAASTAESKGTFKAGGGGGGEGADLDLGDPPPQGSGSGRSSTAGSSQSRRPGARGHLQRNPSMEKVDEEEGAGGRGSGGGTATTAAAGGAGGGGGEGEGLAAGLRRASAEAKARICGPDYFGVKSYLHHFYDTHFYKDPDIYEDDEDEDFRYLLSPHGVRRRRRRCNSIWWKVFVWIGANFLVFGIIGVLVGYLVPQRPIVVGSIADNIEIIDRGAISFNFNLDVCKLVGLILFCIGGLTLTVALLFPSYLYQYCEDEGGPPPGGAAAAFKIRVDEQYRQQDGGDGGDGGGEQLKSPLEMSIPTTTRVSSVQPERKDEAIVTQAGMMPLQRD